MIKMRVNKDKESKCDDCGVVWSHTPEMYDLNICDTTFTLCSKCVETLFQKTLRASVKYNGRMKTKEDMERAKNSRSFDFHNSETLSLSEALKGFKEAE